MYTITCLYSGHTYIIHDPDTKDLRVYDDSLETVDSESGKLRFSISTEHPYADKLVGMESDIRVYDGGDELWRGRVTEVESYLYGESYVECEGELAFLYDSIQPRRELHDISPVTFFETLVLEHNKQVQSLGGIDKTFRVGVVTIKDNNDSLYRYTNRETTYDCILDKLLKRLGGHLSVRVEGGVRYLDLLAETETVPDQAIRLGENLLDFSRNMRYTDIATACIPLGARLETTEIAALDAYQTIASVNGGSEVLKNEPAISRYGFICKTVNFGDIKTAEYLKTAGEKWLSEGQFADLTLELNAVDLHSLGWDISPIRVNSSVRVECEPYGLNSYFQVARRTYHLTQPEADTVTVGRSERQKSFTTTATEKNGIIAQGVQSAIRALNQTIEAERQNVNNLLNQATHGFVVTEPERILIMDTNSVKTARKVWKWDLNGLAYTDNFQASAPQWKTAITMGGQIVADFIAAGILSGIIINGVKINGSTIVSHSTVRRNASDYSQADLDRANAIILQQVTPTNADYEKLDLNLDGQIDILDSVIINNFLKGKMAFKDFNKDLEINGENTIAVIQCADSAMGNGFMRTKVFTATDSVSTKNLTLNSPYVRVWDPSLNAYKTINLLN